jgi:isocitrate dehydrogenase
MSTAAASKITPPAQGAKISIRDGKLIVPENPIIPFIEGDGTGPDIWRASVRVMDAAVQKAYGGKRKIHWMEVLAGEKANKQLNTWLPDETVAACREYRLEADAGSVCLPASRALVQGRAFAGQASRESGHGHLP